MARLVKKTLFVGVFAYLINNWNNLAQIIFQSFAGLGLMASGSSLHRQPIPPARPLAQTGLDAGRPLLTSISDLMGYVSFFENFIQIAVLLFAWALVLLAFFILAIQLFVTLIEFKLTTLAGFVLIPFGLFGKTAFMAERVLGNVISSGIKVLVLAVIVGIGSTLFTQFTAGFGARRPRIDRRHGHRACRPLAARPRHLRPRHRQRPRLRRAAAWRGRGDRHWARRRRHGRGRRGDCRRRRFRRRSACGWRSRRRAWRGRARWRRLHRLQPWRRRPVRRIGRRLRPRRTSPMPARRPPSRR